MGISNDIENFIKLEHNKGMTQSQLAKKYNVAQSYIANLLSGKCKFKKIALRTFEKMFPRATVNLFSEDKLIHQQNLTGDNIAGHYVSISRSKDDLNDKRSINVFKESILDQIIACQTLTAEERLKFVAVARKFTYND